MTPHITVRPTPDGSRFVVIEVRPGESDQPTDRDYGRLDAAVAKAWTKAKKARIPLIVNIDPGRPQAGEDSGDPR